MNTMYPAAPDMPMTHPPGEQRSMVNQSVMSFRAGGSQSMTSRAMTSQSANLTRLLQNDIVNSENFNPTIYSPQCMDVKSRSKLFS